MRQRFVQTMCLALLVAGSVSAASAQNPIPPPLVIRRPVNTTYAIRVINAAESAYREIHKRFGSWQELSDSGVLWDVQKTVEDWRRILLFTTGPDGDGRIAGYRLSLLVSADGSAYSVFLRDAETKGCGLSLFSDQSGLIYQGTPLDCPKAVDWPQYLR
jgi:hypothetical protein